MTIIIIIFTQVNKCFLNSIFKNSHKFISFVNFIWKGVKYVITVKIGDKSPENYEGNLGINIVARNFDTGFIKLDKNIVLKPAKLTKENEEKKLFKRGQTDIFQFEDQDIRTVNLI